MTSTTPETTSLAILPPNPMEGETRAKEDSTNPITYAEDDLFGSDDEQDQTAEQEQHKEEAKPEQKQLQEEEQTEEAELGEETLNVDVADLPKPNDEETIHTIKIPQSVPIISAPFDSEWFDFSNEANQSETAIRWRYVPGSNFKQKETNARLVKWADGSIQLFVGNTALEVGVQDSSNENVHIGVRFRGVLQLQGNIVSKLNVRPLDSQMRAHVATSRQQIQSQGEGRRVKLFETVKDIDPEKLAESLRRVEHERERGDSFSESRRGRREQGITLNQEMLEDSDSVISNTTSTRRSINDDETEAAANKRLLDAKSVSSSSHPPSQRRKK